MPTNIQAKWFGGPKADLGDPIDQSLRFIQANKTCLTKTLSQAGNRRTWTFSTWFKKAPHSYNYRIFTGGNTSGGSTFTSFMLQGDNTIRFYSYNGSSVIHNYISTHQFSDASAWYHMVVAYDTTNATAADRIKIYVNGQRITDWATETHPSLNYDSYINKSGDELNVGTYIGGTSNANNDNFIKGYLAETVFIDGAQLDATNFGRTNEDGVWVNKTYSGSYSGNSFRFKYNSSDGLGYDSSGLGNNFTANNFDEYIDDVKVYFPVTGTASTAALGTTLRGITPNGNGGSSIGVNSTNHMDVDFGRSATSHTLTTSNSGAGVTVYVSPDGTANSWIASNITNTSFTSPQTITASNNSAFRYMRFTCAGYTVGNVTGPVGGFSLDIDYIDTPNNNVPIINPHIKTPTSTVLSEALLKNIDSNGNYPNVIPGTSVCRGKQYWEYEYLNPSGYPYLGLAKAQDIQNGGNWYSSGGGIFYVTASGSVGGWTDNTATGWSASAGDILSCAYDADTQQMQFRLNNGTAVTKTVSGYTGDVVPMISDALSKGARVNFGNYPFKYTPPAGYTGMASNDLDEPAIKDPKKHFDIVTWTGNAVDNRNITGLAFAPDFVWHKQLNGTQPWGMYDTCRGATIRQTSSTNQADSTQADALQAFNSDGFQIGTDGQVNGNGHSYIAYCWKAGGATTADNSAGAGNVPTAGSVKIDGANLTSALAGTIPAKRLSANTTAGFSIVTYTGTGSNGTIAHGLTEAPDLVFYKITSSTNGWATYSFRTPNNYMQLNIAGGESSSNVTFNQTDPTNSVLSVGSSVLTNGNTSSYLAYCWHSVPGFSKVGQHRGNGNTDGNFIHTDFKPRYLLIKSTSTSQGWVVYDTKRHPYNPVDEYYYANLTDATNSSATVEVDFYANGFKFRDTHSLINQSGIYYLYMAFAENPFGGENTAPATAR